MKDLLSLEMYFNILGNAMTCFTVNSIYMILDSSSNISDVIKTVLNFLLCFYEKILHAPKSTKKHQKA